MCVKVPLVLGSKLLGKASFNGSSDCVIASPYRCGSDNRPLLAATVNVCAAVAAAPPARNRNSLPLAGKDVKVTCSARPAASLLFRAGRKENLLEKKQMRHQQKQILMEMLQSFKKNPLQK